jgi:hypothetical protein
VLRPALRLVPEAPERVEAEAVPVVRRCSMCKRPEGDGPDDTTFGADRSRCRPCMAARMRERRAAKTKRS